MLKVMDVLFHVIHIAAIIINTTFWLSRRTLKMAQVTQLLTLISWIGFGFFYGFGYCFLTDWHWQIKEKMGESNLPASYIKYVLDRITGTSWDPDLIDRSAVAVLVISVLGCVIQTVRWRKISNK